MSTEAKVEFTLAFTNTDYTEKITVEDVQLTSLATIKSAITSYNSGMTDDDRNLMVSPDFDYYQESNRQVIRKGGLSAIIGARIITIEETEIEPT